MVSILIDWVVSSGRRTRVDEELAIMFICLKFVGVARDEDVNAELPLERGQRLGIAPRNDLVAMAQANLELAYRHYLLLRISVRNLKPPKDKSCITYYI